MRELGFKELIKAEYQTYIITSFYYPPAPFHFETFYNKLSERGLSSRVVVFLEPSFLLQIN